VVILLLRGMVLLIAALLAAVGVHSALHGEPQLALISLVGAALMAVLAFEEGGKPVSEDAPVYTGRHRSGSRRRYQ
jgi:hypothetical protein